LHVFDFSVPGAGHFNLREREGSFSCSIFEFTIYIVLYSCG
jgi:hypothetical protein